MSRIARIARIGRFNTQLLLQKKIRRIGTIER
jgi:hypothetical protein